MARKLNPDGVPVEIPSIQRGPPTNLFEGIDRRRQHPGRGASSGDDPTAVGPEAGRTTAAASDQQWKAARAPEGATAAEGFEKSSQPNTRIAGGFRVGAPDERAATRSGPGPNASADPIVGWLVVVDGPGRGSSVRLGMGQNSLGRGSNARARINFGDDQISRSDHAMIAYDPKGNTFHIIPGGGPNLAYLENSAVLAPTPLPTRSRIVLGETTLRFVALCDGHFDWNELEAAEGP